MLRCLFFATLLFEHPVVNPHSVSPSPNLDPQTVVRLLLSALQHNNEPRPNAGVEFTLQFSDERFHSKIGGFSGLTNALSASLRPLLDHQEALVEPTQRGSNQTELLVVLVGPNGQARGFVFELTRSIRGVWKTSSIRPFHSNTKLSFDPPKTNI